MSQRITTVSRRFEVEDITYKNARKQSEIDKELGVKIEEQPKIVAPVSLTPEQVKLFCTDNILATQDLPTKRVYTQIIKWIDELQKAKAELNKYKQKELRDSAGEAIPNDIQD